MLRAITTKSITDELPTKQSKSFISNLMNSSSVIQNPRTHKICKIEGESAGESNLTYAAECTKCHIFFVGQTRYQINVRFNGHRSDIKFNPYRCELPRHDQGRDFKKDLQVSVLEKLSGCKELQIYKEDK